MTSSNVGDYCCSMTNSRGSRLSARCTVRVLPRSLRRESFRGAFVFLGGVCFTWCVCVCVCVFTCVFGCLYMLVCVYMYVCSVVMRGSLYTS